MSNPTVLQSRSVPCALSTDNVTYGNTVCKKSWDLNIDKSLIQDESDCGVHTAVGNSTKWSVGLELIFNTTPNSGEYSANDITGWANAGTLVYIKLQYPTSGTPGTTYYRQGAGYFTNVKESAPVNGFITVTATFTGDGTLDNSVS